MDSCWLLLLVLLFGLGSRVSLSCSARRAVFRSRWRWLVLYFERCAQPKPLLQGFVFGLKSRPHFFR